VFIAAVTGVPIKSSRQVCILGGLQVGSKFDHRCWRGAEIISTRVRIEASRQNRAWSGIFGGKYMTDTVDEYPKSWFSGAKLSPRGRDPSLNYFGVDTSQPLSVWREKGWIHADDPRGWFQWYCRYYLGRRLPEEDERQIRRWKAMRRHVAQIRRHCEPGDHWRRPRQRQALLQWAYDSRKL
jgi:hypothetical protein